MHRLALVALVACGSDTSTPDAAPPPPDAEPASFLGSICIDSDPNACPPEHTCEIRGAIGGSADTGYCSPSCVTDPDCTAGYAGPGTPTCFQGACVIVCDAACPPGLMCLPTGGPTDVCAVPE